MGVDFEDPEASLSEQNINFFAEAIEYSLTDEDKTMTWLDAIAQQFDYTITGLNYIFCNDAYLHQINVEYLDHDTLTDIITFDNSEERQMIEGDIFISIDRVRENAAIFNVSFDTELNRVMSHGLLHLLGYGDKTEAEKQEMRAQEDHALELWQSLA
ncbi:rRNA maturation RNase YbeY [marine bacterium AO1-C]|nr:rRNA maturation RNase YbeY [marine bacterium AO1-C]